MNEFWVWFKKSVMTKTVFIVLYKKEGGLNGIVHTFEKRQQRHKIGLPEIGLPIQPEMHSWGATPIRHLHLKERVKNVLCTSTLLGCFSVSN